MSFDDLIYVKGFTNLYSGYNFCSIYLQCRRSCGGAWSSWTYGKCHPELARGRKNVRNYPIALFTCLIDGDTLSSSTGTKEKDSMGRLSSPSWMQSMQNRLRRGLLKREIRSRSIRINMIMSTSNLDLWDGGTRPQRMNRDETYEVGRCCICSLNLHHVLETC